MKYRIVTDSCGDLTPELKRDGHFRTVPITLMVGKETVIDDESFDQAQFLRLLRETEECAKTACPSPERFMEVYDCDADMVFVVTVSKHLSGTYNSACVAKQMFEEAHGAAVGDAVHDVHEELAYMPGDGPSGMLGEKAPREAGEHQSGADSPRRHPRIAVIDSLSASSGELDLALSIRDWCEAGMDFETIERKANAMRDGLNTYFVIESLDTLRKNGRLSGIQAFFATALNIKPVMGADKGTIVKRSQARGITFALMKMCELVAKEVIEPEKKRLVIAHCNCMERAMTVKRELEKRVKFLETVITDTAGTATLYANDGGVVVAV
ncbi:MAG: DegV family protein [Lachnospiraceae bacterium]|nr:DegV family protein [Lachnospiraceae bacterium]